MKYEIMLEILFILLGKDKVSASYLAERFEMSRRTIYRYLECIQLAGVPIITSRGKNGGFTIPSSYKLPASLLNNEELSFVLNSLKAFQEEVKTPQIQKTIEKISSLSKKSMAAPDLTDSTVIIDGSGWGNTAAYSDKMSIIQKCIQEKLKLSIKYHDRSGEFTSRTIEPHALVYKQGVWYVYAFCLLRKEFRLFKTARIQYAQITGENFMRRPFNKEDMRLNFDFIKEEHIDAVFTVEKAALSEVEDWLGIESIRYKKDGSATAEASLPFDGGLINKILGFGTGIKVLSPLSLKEKIAERARQIFNLYQN